jgi:hypothetical protein
MKHSKLLYLRQEVTVDRNRLTLWTKEEKLKVLINNLPYSFGGEHGMSVNNIYMRGWKNLMWVLEFRQNTTELGDILVHPVLVFFDKKNNKFYYKQVHSENEFKDVAGKRNWQRYMKYSNLRCSLYKLN